MNKKIQIAPQDTIDFFEKEVDDFLHRILGFNYGECLVTDESSLRDFNGCGLPDDINQIIEQQVDLLNLNETDRNKRFTNYLNSQMIYWEPYILEKIFTIYQLNDISINDYLIDIARKIANSNKTVH